ncbi:MAG: ECF transporter S component [Lachnospiraceae bacterium]|nr:ECF transporter S component [Lachnospiraceae bacterium]
MSELFQNAKDNLSFLLVSALIVAGAIILAKVVEKLIGFKADTRIRVRRIAFIGIFSAIATVLMLLEIPLPFLAPPFYKIDFSELPVLICAFAYGPVAGMITEFLKVLLKLLFKGTTTAFVGDLANFVIGIMLILPASIIYHIKKTRKNALIGLGAGVALMTVFGTVFNAVYLLPTFAELYGMPLDAIIGMGAEINANITDVTTFVCFCVAPFNLLKGLAVSVLTFFLYKPLSPMIHKVHDDTLQSR